jgi:hypothetical protein
MTQELPDRIAVKSAEIAATGLCQWRTKDVDADPLFLYAHDRRSDPTHLRLQRAVEKRQRAYLWTPAATERLARAEAEARIE